jgi:hypothetical protein
MLAAVAVLHTWPLAGHVHDVIPGDGLGDNVSSLWNFWWMREAVSRPDVSFFQTQYLFAPAGTPLVLHTHTALAAFVGATALGGLPLPDSHNVMLIASVFLNGAAAYALGFETSRKHLPALLAGLLFMLAPPLLTRLMGHFNLVLAWTMVGAVWLAVRMRGMVGATTAGVATGLVAYADYYLFVYTLGILALLFVVPRWRLRVIRNAPRDSALTKSAFILAALCLLTALVIVGGGGFDGTLLGRRLAMRSPDNALLAMWMLVSAGAVVRWRLRIRIDRLADDRGPAPRLLAAAMAAAAATILPLIWLGIQLWQSGGYVTQRAAWRSAPGGADLATLLLGPPFGPLVGDAVQWLYRRGGINPIEASGWLGMSACLLGALGARRWRVDRSARLWTATGIAFFIWSLGPALHVAGVSTGLMLPQQLLRYVPLLGNARMPSRALIVVSLALAVLAALWASNRSRRTVIIAIGITGIELIGMPLRLTALNVPAMYEQLAAMPAGAVLDLPLGYRDGFGETGAFDERAMLFQTVHRHPIAGGFIARLPPHVRQRYVDDPVLSALIELSAGRSAAVPACEQAVAALTAAGFRYVVLNRTEAPEGLLAYVTQLPLTTLAASAGGNLHLYRLDPRCPS